MVLDSLVEPVCGLELNESLPWPLVASGVPPEGYALWVVVVALLHLRVESLRLLRVVGSGHGGVRVAWRVVLERTALRRLCCAPHRRHNRQRLTGLTLVT